ncbi:gamma-interferon-responsive lysosomal thiol protein-like isoform X1 [Hordeum vulgare subsp. vulgare]|uniref:Gamma-interferon-inducible lysosomal thiol reductase n=1 Tax=Hordeum vulgare subsp. vulgare TaxID=112509 RepID=A0A8I6XIQ7_HORVV|nr:gamma-interferon-responsive lysosomal thiol protein-like isoform X1 [Hordeum vulgare subsp. vulgare]
MAARPHHFLILAALLLLIGAPSSAGAGSDGTGKVPVELYYESLCPPSALFVTYRLAEAFEDGLLEVADVTLVPYGNAEVGKDGTITCEHGPEECLLNTVEACAIDAWPDVNVHFGFINCVEELAMNETQGEWESCFHKLGLDPKPVTECYKSEHGHKLSLKYGKQTGALVPPLTGIPWVVVDGKPRDDGDFVYYICKAYKGRPPKICQEPDRHYRTAVEAGNGVSYNSGGFKLHDGVEDKIEVARVENN